MLLATALATAGCAASDERELDAGEVDARPTDAVPTDAMPTDACAPAVPMGCGPDDGALELEELGYERAWIVTWAGFTNGLSLTLGDAGGIGCGARAHVGGLTFREGETWIGSHHFMLSADESAPVDPIAVTLRIDEEIPPEEGRPGAFRGTLELRPDAGEAIVRTDVTLTVCRTETSF